MSERDLAALKKIAISSQLRFEFFLGGLTFAILSLAVQTHAFATRAQAACELAGWAALLFSGLCAVWRLFLHPSIYWMAAQQQEAQNSIANARDAERKGVHIGYIPMFDSPITAQVAITLSQEMRDKMAEQITKRTTTLGRLFGVQLGGFIVGLILLMIGRGVLPLADAWHYLER